MQNLHGKGSAPLLKFMVPLSIDEQHQRLEDEKYNLPAPLLVRSQSSA